MEMHFVHRVVAGKFGDSGHPVVAVATDAALLVADGEYVVAFGDRQLAQESAYVNFQVD